ncbi:probable ATP-dependent RNA helicase spindle-E [Rhopalosiphum maidis]|uniref:probable ATP-dependent RNA helicase spindle-E n=1 Tax=Rhopalosiphum maidis TaxID=43146 RepID=UPI000F00F92E|nr:probable ATP-dependent RNA helicase spindle-E [Rhopalosiphum maidis]XP_026807071.1 probable ATP-dependent RNA helicase spindle-E [Rhopalosiphum maidis]XP_026807072.1 probable ATP-dependent RNA helicase spindle-E [Rhopalosiphum maidis]
MSIWQQFAKGKIEKKILPGSDLHIYSKHKYNSDLPQSSHSYVDYDEQGRSYVNTGLSEYDKENEEYNELSKKALHDSNMSSVDSITYANSVADLKDLDIDEIKLFEHYKFKDPSNKSNDLEIAESKDKIINSINSNCTVLISGATGCGKSTQVPQYILDDCMSKKKYCNIIVTQPRRIAAISVSKQVNKERCWKDGLLVGYQVGRKKNYDPITTKILYCTTGILLLKIIKAKSLSEFSHIILDEVHERTLEMDFLLLIIKKLQKSNSQSTRVILMSATAETEKLRDYFGDYYGHPYNRHQAAPLVTVDKASNYTIHVAYLDDLYGLIPSARKMEFGKTQIDEAGYETAVQLVKAFDEMKVDNDDKKSVLIFLPGIYEIEEMHRRMEDLMISENHKWILIPLHSSITSEEQDKVFIQTPLNYRKIILSTNIAESSITVPDVSFVIDFCLMKQLKNEMRSNYSMLIMTWASKSNCNQRAGRVGRVADGRVYRLIPKRMYNEFNDNELPEMSRCSLSRVVLMSKILDMGTPKQLLASALDAPCLKNIILTIRTLKQVGALLSTVNGVISSMDGDITYMGKVMAHLPLEPPMSKLIYFGYIFNILSEAMIMACGLSIKSIFSQPFNQRLEAYTQKLTWANYSCSDPIAYIGAYQSWLDNKPEFDRNRNFEKTWAFKNYIQLSAIRELYDLIDDVSNRLNRNFGIVANSGKMKWTKPEEKAMACKVILAGAFYPNYFIRGTNNAYMDEHEVLKTLNEHDPYRTVYFTGFPNDQPKELYKEAIESLFPQKIVGKPTAHFSTSNKVYVEFPMSNIKNTASNNNQYEEKENQLVPGNICYGVYVAIKMRTLKFNFNIPLLKPNDAKKKVELITQQMAAQKIFHKEVLPIQHCILEEIESNNRAIVIMVTFFESVDRFWAQIRDEKHHEILINLWNFVNHKISLLKINPENLEIGNIYIVMHKNEKYRGKLMEIPHGPKKKYTFLLIDFGETVQLCVENIFNIEGEDTTIKVYSFPILAFQCKIAKIRSPMNRQLKACWSEETKNFVVEKLLKNAKGKIYSIVDGVVSFEDLTFINEEESISISEYLIKNNLATRTEESFASKIDHEKRIKLIGSINNEMHQKSNVCFNLKSPTEGESYAIHNLKGPISPLEMSVNGISRNSTSKIVKIESQSVNSILLDTDPNDYHERLFVAGNVCLNENDKLTLWDTTMMPNIPGMPTIICLIFSPCVEIRHNSSYTKMIGAICGLGYHPETGRPLFEENDIEITFDTVIDLNFLNKINVIRMLLNRCVNPEDEEGPGDIFQIQHSLQISLIEIFSQPTKFKGPEPYSRKYMWSEIRTSRLQSPYQENSPVNHPMAGSDVYKLLWGTILSQKMSATECKDLMFKLSKIKRLEECLNFNNYTSERCLEELRCPLCNLVFTNTSSVLMHFDNYQHIERYKLAKEELQLHYTGPFRDIKNL